jgi:chaperonin GroES
VTDAAYAQPDDIELNDDEPDENAEKMAAVDKVKANIAAQNLAEELDENELNRIGQKVVEEYEIDEESRKEHGWTERNKAAMDLALQVRTAKNHPWPNASNIKYPLISTAAIQFNARAYPAVIDGFNVVKGRVLGEDQDGQKAQRAERIGDHMSYQLLQEMDGWEEDTDRLLMMLPIVGCAFRKSYFDPVRGKNRSELVPPDKFVVNYWAKDLETTPRATHVLEFYPNEIQTKMRGGLWLTQELGLPQDAANDDQAPHTFLEQHRLLDLDDDGYAEPYIVTVHKESMKVLRIVARYDEKGIEADASGKMIVCIKPVRMFTKYGFIPSPDGSFYDIGFGTLLTAFNETINTTLNQIMDAGTLANTQGGFIGAGVTMKSGSTRFQMGEFKRLDTGGQMLKDSIVPFQFAGPSPVLFNLLTMLIDAAKDVTATQDILTGDTQKANQPVGTTLAVIEQGLKTFSAIVKRIHRSLGQELACLFRLNEDEYYRFQDKEGAIARQDYAVGDVDVIPVSDPSMATDMQKMGRAQFLQQFRADPLMDGQEINKRVLTAAGIQDVDKLFAPPPQGPPPELQEKMKAAEQKDRELDQKADELELKRASAMADIGLRESQAIKAIADALMTGAPVPEVAALISQMVNATLDKADDGQGGPVQQADVRGMAGPPADGPVQDIPEGPAGGPGVPMDGGPVDGPPAADQGSPDGGVGGPGMGGPGPVL